MVGPVLAHQGGCDELLVLASPIVMFALLAVIGRRRARRQAALSAALTDVPGNDRDPDAPSDPRDTDTP